MSKQILDDSFFYKDEKQSLSKGKINGILFSFWFIAFISWLILLVFQLPLLENIENLYFGDSFVYSLATWLIILLGLLIILPVTLIEILIVLIIFSSLFSFFYPFFYSESTYSLLYGFKIFLWCFEAISFYLIIYLSKLDPKDFPRITLFAHALTFLLPVQLIHYVSWSILETFQVEFDLAILLHAFFASSLSFLIIGKLIHKILNKGPFWYYKKRSIKP